MNFSRLVRWKRAEYKGLSVASKPTQLDPILDALRRLPALSDLFAPQARRALWVRLAGALVLLFVLWLGATVLLQLVDIAGLAWLDRVIGVLGSLAAIVLAWLLFPR